MWTLQQKAFCVIEFAISGSPIVVQRAYRKKFGKNVKAPDPKNIKRWLSEYLERGTSERKKRVGNKLVRTEEQEEAIIAFFRGNPTVSVRAAYKLG